MTNIGKGYDVSIANLETGYFTKKVLSQEDEAYVHLSADKKALTFYFEGREMYGDVVHGSLTRWHRRHHLQHRKGS